MAAVAQINSTDVQLGNQYEGAKLRRLVQDIQRMQKVINSLIQENTAKDLAIAALSARVAALEP